MNDMPPFEVPPLSREDATYLAGCLLLGEKIPCKDLATVAQTVAEASSRVPFYVQHIADWMRQQEGKSWTPAHVRKALREIFATAGDPAELKYYDARLDQYYPADIADKARSILDTLSTEKRGLTFDKVLNLVRHRPKTLTVDSDQLRHVIHTLHQDHYIVRRKDRLLFKLEIVRQWWRQERGGTGA